MSADRFRYTLAAGAIAVVIGTAFAAVGMSRYGESVPVTPAAAGTPASPTAPAAVGELSRNAGPMASARARLARRPGPPTPTQASPAPTVTPKRAPSPVRTAARASTTAPRAGDTVVDQVLAHINAARAAHGLSRLTPDARLSKAAALHTGLMSDGCGMKHQCPGEGDLGDRISAQDVRWSSVGENIGYATSGSSGAEIVRAANGLTDVMLAERPPDDGHRKNLLNGGFHRIGLSVVRDAEGVTWLTQDFAN